MSRADSEISFHSVSVAPEGTIYELLHRSYHEWWQSIPSTQDQLINDWREFERFAYSVTSQPAGRCFFLTLLRSSVVGLGSFDPRGLPEFAAVGQNCVDPNYRQRGIGSHQLRHIISLMQSHESFQSSTEIRVLTGASVHFAPARAMYESVGFVEASRGRDEYGPNVTYILRESTCS